jgi:hypothetical protein
MLLGDKGTAEILSRSMCKAWRLPAGRGACWSAKPSNSTIFREVNIVGGNRRHYHNQCVCSPSRFLFDLLRCQAQLLCYDTIGKRGTMKKDGLIIIHHHREEPCFLDRAGWRLARSTAISDEHNNTQQRIVSFLPLAVRCQYRYYGTWYEASEPTHPVLARRKLCIWYVV